MRDLLQVVISRWRCVLPLLAVYIYCTAYGDIRSTHIGLHETGRIQCLSNLSEHDDFLVRWIKSISDDNFVEGSPVVAAKENGATGTTYATGNYKISEDFSLVIKNATRENQGFFGCFILQKDFTVLRFHWHVYIDDGFSTPSVMTKVQPILEFPNDHETAGLITSIDGFSTHTTKTKSEPILESPNDPESTGLTSRIIGTLGVGHRSIQAVVLLLVGFIIGCFITAYCLINTGKKRDNDHSSMQGETV